MMHHLEENSVLKKKREEAEVTGKEARKEKNNKLTRKKGDSSVSRHDLHQIYYTGIFFEILSPVVSLLFIHHS